MSDPNLNDAVGTAEDGADPATGEDTARDIVEAADSVDQTEAAQDSVGEAAEESAVHVESDAVAETAEDTVEQAAEERSPTDRLGCRTVDMIKSQPEDLLFSSDYSHSGNDAAGKIMLSLSRSRPVRSARMRLSGSNVPPLDRQVSLCS